MSLSFEQIMSYELIITEKPNAAKKIAVALADGKPIQEKKGKVSFYKITHDNKDIIVGCAVGHLYGVKEKDKGIWTYPIFNTEWAPTFELNKQAAFTKPYLNMIKKLAKEANKFTVATDYDIEGEVIGYNVLRFACKQKDASRMKFSTLTPKDLQKAYDNKSSTLNWGQLNAGITRHEMDWLYGINLSRALTLSIKSSTGRFKLLSVGRVQGPALKILVDKEREILKFVPKPYWQIELTSEKNNQLLVSNHNEDKIFDKEKAEQIYSKIKNEKSVKVQEIKTKRSNQSPPVPFDLTSLQIEAYRTLKISPKRTLEIAQELYTGGYISYPRTSSQKLPKEIGFKEILEKLKEKFKEAEKVLKTKLEPNEGKKTDDAHPAIYPTGIIPNLKDPKTSGLYELIVRRFFSVFGEPAVRETVSLILNVKDELFVTSGTRTVEKGWHEFYGRFVMLKEEELPALNEGELLIINKIDKLSKETQPPKRYTESSIIKELEKRGLGTKSTRAQIIENLFNRGYLHEKTMQPTQLGMRTLEILEKYSPRILDEKLTEHFEEEMEEIRISKKDHDTVIEEVKEVLTKILNEFKKKENDIGKELTKATEETRHELSYIGKCPICKEGELHLRKGKFGEFIACNKYPDCETTFSIPLAKIKPTGKICEVCNYPIVLVIKKKKAPQEICINPYCPSKVDDKKKERLQEVLDGKEIICPKCKEHNLTVRKSIYGAFLGCKGYPKCRYTEKEEKEE